jgi:hypothetical protein
MFPSNRRVRALLILTAATCMSSVTPAFSQAPATPPAGNSAQASPMSTQPEASATTPAQQRAAKKAARKANRAQKNAELQKLEKNGYNPSASQNDYPEDIQKAEKKANGQ